MTRLKVFTLYAKEFWHRKHSQVRRHAIEAVLRRSDVEGFVSGPGWGNYDPSATLQQNIDRSLPGADVCWMYKPEGHPQKGIPTAIEPEQVQALKVVRMHECWWDDRDVTKAMRRKDVLDGHVDLAVCVHENDLPRLAELGVDAVHIPQTAEPSVFECHTPLAARPINCSITGSVSHRHYPLRCRLRHLIRSNQVSGAELPHPGYWMNSEQANARQLAKYASHLRSTKILLTCSSKWKYALGKIVEAMQAGCVVACDMPDNGLFRRTLGKHILELDPVAPDGVLAAFLNAWLQHPAELQKLAIAGQRVALADYSMDAYAERFVNECRKRLYDAP